MVSSFFINIMQPKPIIIKIMAMFGMLPVSTFAYGRFVICVAILKIKSYVLCANSNGLLNPTNAVIVPIITIGIMIKENSGKNTRFPINPYIGTELKWAITKGAVNNVAVNAVKNAA